MDMRRKEAQENDITLHSVVYNNDNEAVGLRSWCNARFSQTPVDSVVPTSSATILRHRLGSCRAFMLACCRLSKQCQCHTLHFQQASSCHPNISHVDDCAWRRHGQDHGSEAACAHGGAGLCNHERRRCGTPAGRGSESAARAVRLVRALQAGLAAVHRRGGRFSQPAQHADERGVGTAVHELQALSNALSLMIF